MPSARQAFVAYGGPPLAADAAYEWTVQPRGYAEAGTGLRTGAVHDRTAADRLAGAVASPGRRVPAAGPGDLSPDRGGAACRHSRPGHRVHLGGAHLSLVRRRRADRCLAELPYPDEQYARAVDLTGTVTGGRRSAIGVLHRWYGAGKGRPASTPGLLVQLSLRYGDGRHVVFGSDATWREQPAEWLPSPQRNSDACDFVEWVDGREHPSGWTSPGYDDSAWPPATVIGPAGSAPFSRTYAQRTRITEHAVSPVRVHTLATGSVVVDFGAVYPARPRVEFTFGSGRTVHLTAAGYLLDAGGAVSTTHGTQGTNLYLLLCDGDGPQTFEAFSYLGFRYLQIDDPCQAIGPGRVDALACDAAMPEVPPATFTSGERRLDAVWELNARSCLYCCHEQFVDTPTREKAQFLWDAANESEAVMRAYGEQNLSWQGLRDGPWPGPLLARRPGQRRLPVRLRRSGHPHVHRALSGVALALLPLDRRPRHCRRPVPERGPCRRLALGDPPARYGPPLWAGRRARGRPHVRLRPRCRRRHGEQRARRGMRSTDRGVGRPRRRRALGRRRCGHGPDSLRARSTCA